MKVACYNLQAASHRQTGVRLRGGTCIVQDKTEGASRACDCSQSGQHSFCRWRGEHVARCCSCQQAIPNQPSHGRLMPTAPTCTQILQLKLLLQSWLYQLGWSFYRMKKLDRTQAPCFGCSFCLFPIPHQPSHGRPVPTAPPAIRYYCSSCCSSSASEQVRTCHS